MSSEVATSIPEREVRRRHRAVRRQPQVLAVQLLGPATILAGLVWAVAQPYRIAFLDPGGKGVYDYLFQPPLLVVLVGLVYSIAIAPGLVADLEGEDRGPAA